VIALELITETDRLCEFEPEWSAFTNTISPETPFQTSTWLMTWWKYFGSGEPRVMVFRYGGRVVGVMPLFLHVWNGRRQLTLIGSGITDYLDPLFTPEWSSQIAVQIRRELQAWDDWDICDWQDLSVNTPLQALGALASDTPCSFVPIDRPFSVYLESRPKDLKRNLRRYKEKAEAIAPVTFDVARDAGDGLLSSLAKLHRARWEKAGERGMIEANRSDQFLYAIGRYSLVGG